MTGWREKCFKTQKSVISSFPSRNAEVPVTFLFLLHNYELFTSYCPIWALWLSLVYISIGLCKLIFEILLESTSNHLMSFVLKICARKSKFISYVCILFLQTPRNIWGKKITRFRRSNINADIFNVLSYKLRAPYSTKQSYMNKIF